jgi:hypothetical protein
MLVRVRPTPDSAVAKNQRRIRAALPILIPSRGPLGMLPAGRIAVALGMRCEILICGVSGPINAPVPDSSAALCRVGNSFPVRVSWAMAAGGSDHDDGRFSSSATGGRAMISTAHVSETQGLFSSSLGVIEVPQPSTYALLTVASSQELSHLLLVSRPRCWVGEVGRIWRRQTSL